MKLCIITLTHRDTWAEQEVWLGDEAEAQSLANAILKDQAPKFVRARFRSLADGPHHPNVQFWWRQKARQHAQHGTPCLVVPEWAKKTYEDAYRRVRKT